MNYQVEISETSDYLAQLERATKDLKARDRVRFIWFLKIGKAATQEQAGALIGVQVRQSQRLWKQYREDGLMRSAAVITLADRQNWGGSAGNLARAIARG